MLDLLLGLISGGGGTLATIAAVVVAFLGWGVHQNLKGRRAAKAKSDKQLRDAVDEHSDDVQAAADAGARPDTGELHDDDGFRRD